jgi:hypothetical protein
MELLKAKKRLEKIKLYNKMSASNLENLLKEKEENIISCTIDKGTLEKLESPFVQDDYETGGTDYSISEDISKLEYRLSVLREEVEIIKILLADKKRK